MLPIQPATAAAAYLHTSGSTPQSAARRFWVNRFRTGGARLFAPGLSYAQPSTPGADGAQFTGVGGVPGFQASNGVGPIRPFAYVPPAMQPSAGPMMRAQYDSQPGGGGPVGGMVQSTGAPTDLMGERRKVFQPAASGLQQGALGPLESISQTTLAGRFTAPVGNNPLWENTEAGLLAKRRQLGSEE